MGSISLSHTRNSSRNPTLNHGLPLHVQLPFPTVTIFSIPTIETHLILPELILEPRVTDVNMFLTPQRIIMPA